MPHVTVTAILSGIKRVALWATPTESQPGDKYFMARGLVRRGRPLTSQTAFGGQLPYEGSLGRPAVKNVHTPNGSMWHGLASCGLRTANCDPCMNTCKKEAVAYATASFKYQVCSFQFAVIG